MTRSRIWDLRRGDDDDNRTSTQSGGLRGLLIPTLLEFNYLKAPLSFVILVLGPAILVGIAPSVVITYGQFVLHAATLARSRVITGLAFLVILLAAATWGGRRFFTAAFAKARHLHYTLIFPIFVALREVLRTIGDRFGGRSLSPEKLSRRRRWATILAALLFCIAGVSLALSAEVSIGLKLVDVERLSAWATVKATLGNAAVVLGISTVIESLQWLRRELSLKRPVLDWVPVPSNASSILRIAHLSDPHLVGERYGYRMETGMYGSRGNRRFRHALRKLVSIHARTPLDHIVMTGDITDAGTRAEWVELIDILRGYPELRKRVSIVPGNHDVNIVDRTNPGRLDLPWSVGPALRKLRFILALDAIQGERTFLVDRPSFQLGPSLRDYLRDERRAELLRELAQRGVIRGRSEIVRTWNSLFPLVEPIENNRGGLILLNSNASSHLSLTNAIGVVDPEQMKALNGVLRNSPRRAWIILLHHQVVEYPIASIPLRDRIGLALVNAPELLATITPYASRVLVLHGHRHRDWIGTCEEVVLCSAPSATLGCEEAKDPQGIFHIHEIAMEVEGHIRLVKTQRVGVA